MNSGNPPYKAAQNGHTQLAQVLLDAGAEINAKGYNNETALYVAARYGHVDMVKLLVAKALIGVLKTRRRRRHTT
jgi:ankyrin repeat protein